MITEWRKPLEIPVFYQPVDGRVRKRYRMDKSTRDLIKGVIKIAGYHEDTATLNKYMTEPGFGFKNAIKAWRMGVNMRLYGVACPCVVCKKMETDE